MAESSVGDAPEDLGIFSLEEDAPPLLPPPAGVVPNINIITPLDTEETISQRVAAVVSRRESNGDSIGNHGESDGGYDAAVGSSSSHSSNAGSVDAQAGVVFSTPAASPATSTSTSTSPAGAGAAARGVAGLLILPLARAAPPTTGAAEISLPLAATHAYLGEATTGSAFSRTDLEAGSIVEMPILPLPGVVLFPGESLPLRLHNPAYATLARSMLGGTASRSEGEVRDGGRWHGQDAWSTRPAEESVLAARHLGVVNTLSSRRGGLLVRTCPVGTTAEIRSGYGAGEDSGGGELAVMARGRHRFRLVDDLGWRRGVRYWKVVISADLCPAPMQAPIPHAFRNSRGGRHWAMATPRFTVEANSPAGLAARAIALLREQREPLLPPSVPDDDGSGNARRSGGIDEADVRARATTSSREMASGDGSEQRGSTPRAERGHGEEEVRRRRRRRRFAYDQGQHEQAQEDEEEKMDQDDEEERGRDVVKERKVDPTLFSFWLAANLPLDDDARQELLMLDSVVMRLRLEVKHLERSRTRPMCCGFCGSRIALEGDVFTLPGAEGVVGAYVNAMGCVHQTVTVRKAWNLVLDGNPEVEHSWFPGYAWTSALCRRCPNHLGWHFIAVDQGTGVAAPRSSSLASAGTGTGAEGFRSEVDGRLTRGVSQLGPKEFYGLRRSSLLNRDDL